MLSVVLCVHVPALCLFNLAHVAGARLLCYYYSHDSNHLVLVQFRSSFSVNYVVISLLNYCAMLGI